MAAWAPWTHLRQVVLVRVLARDGRDGPERVLEDRYYVTNLVRGRLDGNAMLGLVRAHWRIENNLHGTLDIRLAGGPRSRRRARQRAAGDRVAACVLAYNLLSVMRAVHLRTVEARAATWDQLRNWVRDAMVWPDLAGDDVEALPASHLIRPLPHVSTALPLRLRRTAQITLGWGLCAMLRRAVGPAGCAQSQALRQRLSSTPEFAGGEIRDSGGIVRGSR